MPKGYLVANIRVNDPEVFKKFSQTALPIIEQYGGKILARGSHAVRHEGNVAGVVTMLEFESKEAAETFYFSDDYQAVTLTAYTWINNAKQCAVFREISGVSGQ